MQDIRTAGVLLHISSLNGPFGIGVMGKQAKDFVDKLSAMDFHYWQVLPLNPVDASGSPYCSFSAFAGNISLIDPIALGESGLLTDDEVEKNKYHDTQYVTDYDFAYQARLEALKKAYCKIDSGTKSVISLFESQNSWVADFAYFMVLKDLHEQKPWWEWDEKYADYSKAQSFKEVFKDEIDFYVFTQYIFFTQWRSLKEYANSKNVFLIGDMPIYVSRDSVDIWSNIDLFKINKTTLAPTEVAGVPPDYFSADGQLWGNPLYDWDKMEKDNYSWWIKRIGSSLKLYDRVRIDHFRAFASYWTIPADSETAKNGSWKKGPGMKLFDQVNRQLENPDIIAEDLGIFGDDVVKLLKDSNFPGMRVIQFGFDPDGDSTHLPHNYPKNSIAYVGTHDNNTILGWLWEAGERERAYALRYCCFGGNNWGDGGFHSGSCRAVIETVWRSASNTAIVAFQDMCGFGSDARMNIPGTAEKNWAFRISDEALGNIDTAYYKEINSIYRRTYIPERTV